MKNIMLSFVVLFNLMFSEKSFSQQSDETLIRTLENNEREAILKGDTVQLSKLMSKNIVVQNPENVIVGYRKIIDRIKSGKINYTSFERKIENIAFMNGIAVVMGLEAIVPKGDIENTGKMVKRRFTNIWAKENGNWKLTARQATIVPMN
jgi:hypothetical protein